MSVLVFRWVCTNLVGGNMSTMFTRARPRLRWNFLSNRHGGMAVTFALSLIPILLAVGFGLDILRATNARSEMQNVLDAAAIAAATQTGATDAKRQDIGIRFFTAQYPARFGGTVSKTTFAVEKDRLVAQSSGNVPTTFMRLAGKTSINIGAMAEVKLNPPKSGACVVFRRFRISGSFRIDPKCGFHVYEPAIDAFWAYGSFANYNSDVSTAGGFWGNSHGKSIKKGVPPMRHVDPVGKLGKVTGKRCVDHKSPVVVKPGRPTIIGPGTYCKKLMLYGGELHLRPGVYVLQREIEVRDRAVMTGSGVTIIFTQKARFFVYTYIRGRMDTGKTGLEIRATAPRSGRFKNILFYQAPSAANRNYIRGHLNFVGNFSGLVYLPGMDFYVRGAFSFKTISPAAIVARNFWVRGAAHFHLPDDSLISLISGQADTPYLVR